MTELKLPLKGLKVVELSTVVATPVTARLLSDFGAEVIKVETPPFGDLLRPTGKGHMLPTEEDNNPLFDAYNSGKKLVSINLKHADGMRLFHELLADADVFLTNVRMQSLEKMQLDYEHLKEKYPRLIYGHFSGFGLKGEEANRPGFDTTAFWMRSGASVDPLVPNTFPLRPSFAFGDIATASEFLAGILMGVIGREKTGQGTMVTTSLQHSAIWCNTTSILNAQPQYAKQYPVDRYTPWDPFSDYYRCKDGEFIGFMKKNFTTDRYLFAKLFDYPELTTDPELMDEGKMRECGRVPEVTARIEKVILQKTSEEWRNIFEENDVAYEIARHFKDVYLDPQARANGCFEDIEYPNGVITAHPTPPFTFSEYGRKPFQKTGAVGRDTKEILNAMGYDDAALAQLTEQQAIL